MCRQLDVPRSSYYRWRDATDTPTTIRHRELTDQVKTMFDSSDEIFGHRMVHTKLTADGVAVSVGTVATIMAENGWQARRMRAFKRTTNPGDPDKVFKDLIGRDFTAETPGTRLVGDITYLRTGEGWLYLATVIDLCTRMIVGWAMADHMRASLCISALEMARDKGHLQANGIFHSDHGAQYTSRELGTWCTGNNIRQSMGLAGVCDNALAETVNGYYKAELVRGPAKSGPWKTIDDLELATLGWVHWHNTPRLHSYIGDVPPAEFEQAFYAGITSAKELVEIK
ncbi:IS3 family transposase [Arthrobacter psychrolactophilus]|uniref:IS3 family transposase n=2 Tax=Arthrobacter psychrolactophilus TaxID=92442 RepID=A0A2V5JD76_9MICC|nr:IS3 family transposase [Arthrobacter psychrolactophilus]